MLIISICMRKATRMKRVNALPSSCGSSSQSIANDTLNPVTTLSVKAAPIDSPSTNLCSESPIKTIQATVFICCKALFFSVSDMVRDKHYVNPYIPNGIFHFKYIYNILKFEKLHGLPTTTWDETKRESDYS